jgi:hypothetical protein
MRRRVRRSPRRALRWDARPARPRRPSHSSTTNLGGSTGSPVMSAAQGRHPRLRLSRSPRICACEDDGQDQVLSEYILLPTAKLVAPRSVRAGDSFVRVSA